MSGQRLFALLFQLSLVLLALAWWNKDQLPEPGFYGPALLPDPVQTATETEAFETTKGGEDYRVKPLFDYDLQGVIVSQNEAMSFGDIYHEAWGDHLNLKDLCVIWGKNLNSGVYKKMGFKNTAWTCWYQWSDAATGQAFSEDQLSNNHLLTDDPLLAKAILKTRVGDLVRIKGYLAEYENKATDFKRGTSTSRTDRGNGACETLYVKDFQVLKPANRGWYLLYRLSFWLMLISGGFWVYIVARSGPRRLR